jgi:hypothetical protein
VGARVVTTPGCITLHFNTLCNTGANANGLLTAEPHNRFPIPLQDELSPKSPRTYLLLIQLDIVPLAMMSRAWARIIFVCLVHVG